MLAGTRVKGGSPMSLIPGLGNKYLACALAAGLSAALASLAVLPDPRPQDYAVLVAEVGIGVAIAIVVYGISRRNEIELEAIAQNTNSMLERQEILNRSMAESAEEHLRKILYEMQKAADEVLNSKQAYDGAGKGEKPFYKSAVESKCQDLEYLTKAMTDVFPSIYLMKNMGRAVTLHRQCVQNSRDIDKMDVNVYKVVKAEAQSMSEEIRRSSVLSAPPDAHDADELGRHSLSVSASSTVYPLNSVVYVRAKIERLLDGNVLRYEILGPEGDVVERRDLDPGNPPDPDLAQYGIFEVSFRMRGRAWKVGGAYAVRATYGPLSAQDAFSITQDAPVVQTDKDAYVAGSDMIITVIDPDANTDGNAVERAGDRGGSKLVIESPRGRISGYLLTESGTDTGIFQGTVRIADASKGRAVGPAVEPAWRWLARRLSAALRRDPARPRRGKGPYDGVIECGRGEEIRIKYANRAGAAVHAVRAARFGATVETDQKVYTCTDRVRITVVAPDLDAGAARSCPVSVKTSIGRLEGYGLAEREPDSGIYEGSVSLTGFAGMAGKARTSRQLGETRGAGPDDGMLACMNEDTVEVTAVQGAEAYRGSALARWNVGSVQFSRRVYAVGDLAVVKIVDPDMNLDPEAIDSFGIRVRSDSDREGIEIEVAETAAASGIFEGEFEFDFERSSQADAVLRVSYGDTVSAEYEDTTLPPPSGLQDRQLVGSAALISADKAVPSPLTRLKILSIDVKSKATGLGTLTPDEQALAKVTVGGAKRPYSFTVLLQIEDSEGAVQDLFHHPAHIDPQREFECAFAWTPAKPGKFVFEVFLWKSLDDLTPFSPTKKANVRVV